MQPEVTGLGEFVKIEKGQPLPLEMGPTPAQEGGRLAEAFPKLICTLFLQNPTAREIESLDAAPIEIKLTTLRGCTFLCFQSRFILWQEIPVSLAKIPPEDRPDQASIAEFEALPQLRLGLTILLCDWGTREVRALRFGTLSHRVSLEYVRSLVNDNMTPNQHDRTVTECYNAYKAGEIAALSRCRCWLGE